ncbi:MAG TPA: tRNA 2-thiouridine(34) synthase MnmA [Acidimicrobiales bacterium]|nr:tRNA 2-thiouridine(34) synthase MnmA [Acidimicrobiales bacterium]
MKVLVAMSGGVDSSVAAAELIGAGHQVVGATMKLWGGHSDTGCCSVADVEDARRVAGQLGVEHHVFNFTDDFEARVVSPYVDEHLAGRTPNPCVECNRHLKFDRLLHRARQLGFDAVATGHHARVEQRHGRWALLRGRDADKDQSYVLSMLGQAQLAHVLLPVGEMTKAEVRRRAAELGLATAVKPDSQDVCFIGRADRRAGFIGARAPLKPGRLVDARSGEEVGTVDAVELVTVGQRRGMGSAGDGGRRYAVAVDVASATVTVGDLAELMVTSVPVGPFTWVDGPLDAGAPVSVQTSAHGATVEGTIGAGRVDLTGPIRRVAPGQTVAVYRDDAVLGSAVAG